MAKDKNTEKMKSPVYEQILDLNDDKINILVLGTSGSGKSTLINAVLNEDKAATGIGEAVTREIAIYQNEELPFRMIDTVGYEYGFFRQNRIKRELRKFSKEGVKTKDIEKLIHMIWFCIDGTGRRIDQTTLGYIRNVSNEWENVPILVVLTKSYSEVEIDENVKMVDDAIKTYNEKHHRRPLNYKGVVPVVAKDFPISQDAIVPQRGLDDLVNKTNELTPLAKTIGREGVKNLDLKMKASMANSMITTSTVGAVTVGAVPIPIPDSTLLVPIQTGMMWRIADIYGIQKNDTSNKIVNTTLKVGATTVAGRSIVKGLQSIPGLNLAGSLVNAAVAGSVTYISGQACRIIFEKIYVGEMEEEGTDWEKEIREIYERYAPKILDAFERFAQSGKAKPDAEDLKDLINAFTEETQKEEENEE